MANLCNAICSGTSTATNLRDLCDSIELVKGGLGYIGFIKCGTALDMTSAATIAAAKTANTLILMSAGIGSKGDLYRLFWIDCNDNIYFDTTALVSENPGFEYGAEGGHNITENDLTDNQTFEFTLTVETNSETAIICPTPMTTAIRTAILN